jgi:arsenate reductase-like glutaredoxin family protein
MLLPLEIVTNGRRNTETPSGGEVSAVGNDSIKSLGIKELACGSQAPIATLLFDPSMSALPIIVKHNSQRVGLFTR